MLAAVSDSLPFAARFVLAFSCFFRVLFDGRLARRVNDAVQDKAPELPPKPAREEKQEPPSMVPALQLLGLLQREGRFVDFVKQDIAGFSDAEIGAAARVVHEGCRKALGSHASIESLRKEDEGSKLTLEAGYEPSEVKLTGNVQGAAPYRGTLRHKGWRATKLELPSLVAGHDPHLLYPAEVEL